MAPLLSSALETDSGDFYAQMKAPKRERDLSTGALRYRWSETGALDLYRHAHAFDHLASFFVPLRVCYLE